MESTRHIRITFTVPEGGPIILRDPPLNRSSVTSPDNALEPVEERHEGSLPETTSPLKVITTALQFSAEIETFHLGQTLSEVVKKTYKLAEQLKAEAENAWTAGHMLKLQDCFGHWQNKRLCRYKTLEHEIYKAIQDEDPQHDPGLGYVHRRR